MQCVALDGGDPVGAGRPGFLPTGQDSPLVLVFGLAFFGHVDVKQARPLGRGVVKNEPVEKAVCGHGVGIEKSLALAALHTVQIVVLMPIFYTFSPYTLYPKP